MITLVKYYVEKMINDVNLLKDIDNGGAIAKKGFNFQDAIATLIIITNFSKEDFCIYLECRDDMEVDLNNQKIFIQVKSAKVSISNLIRASKSKNGECKKSILCKNLSKNSSNKLNKYKIATTSYNEGTTTITGEIFKEIYQYTNEQKNIIIEKLSNQGLSKEELEQKLENSYIYVSPFDDNLGHAFTHLLGVLAEEGISIDNNRGQLLLNELLIDIKMKSEKKIVEPLDIEKKKIKKEDLTKLSKVEKCFEYMDELTKALVDSQTINLSDRITINKYFRIVDLKHKSEYKIVEDCIGEINTSGRAEEVIKHMYEKAKATNIDTNLLYAILIDKYVMNAYIGG